MNFKERLVRHLSFANVIACLALFVALGGGAYAASSINGKSIVNKSIGAGKLKNGTLTSSQVKKGSLNGSVIDSSSLGTVPAAQTAVTAQTGERDTATSATSADRATTATSAETAARATSAATAESATHAESADNATNADNATHAESADHATHATTADTATSAGDADTVGGKSAADLTVACPADTELYGGMCWDETVRPIKSWIGADIECAQAGGRLPTIGELVAFIARPNEQVTAQNWSGDLDTVKAGEDVALSSDENGRAVSGTKNLELGFRCVFPQTN